MLKYLGEYHPAQLATVIVMTAFGASAMERLSPQPGHFLEKPFEVDALVRDVAECLRVSTTRFQDLH